MGPPCSDGCYDTIPLPTRECMFKQFWEVGDYMVQKSFLQKQVKQVPVKRHRKTKIPDNPGKRRSYNLQYTLTMSGTSYPVCKKGFLNILGIKKGRVETAIKTVNAAGITQPDKRGRRPRTTYTVSLQCQATTHHQGNNSTSQVPPKQPE
ncbi:hypothetical protein Pmani_000348 [Petrolisthes manimaculis]|uniref:Uncharacterized protein n=1 Tax=Petrolisthes manimaculis TaxID=1843537 RepID=A0AAE1UT43_9EUCA|nr:hypothetical protein Pmani_000348 [Petrolisthes manimaculis]